MEHENIRVLYITNMYPRGPGSYSGIFVKQEIDELKKLGLSIDLLFIDGQKNKLSYLNIFSFINGINKKYNLINVNYSLLLPQTIISKRILNLDTPIIFTLHEGGLGHTIKDTDNVLKHLINSTLWRKPLLKYVNLVITKNIETFNYLKTEVKNIEIPTAVDTTYFRPISKEIARKKIGIEDEGLILFFPANINNADKNFPFIQKILPTLKSKISGNLTFLSGPQPPEKMIWFYNAADVVIFPSFYECSPVVIKEAMSCNRPLVTSNVGDIKRVIGHTYGCFVINEWNEEEYIDKILEAAKVSSTNGRERLLEKGYDWPQTAKKLYTILMAEAYQVNK